MKSSARYIKQIMTCIYHSNYEKLLNSELNGPLAQQNIAQAATFSIVKVSMKTAIQLRETTRYTNQQAVIECGSDAKTVERRGEV
jgi:hypothetical protein